MDSPSTGRRRRRVVVATLERGVGADGPDLQRAQGDLIGRRRRPHGEDDGARHPPGLADAPFEDTHAAHGPPDEARPPIDPELVRQGDLDGHLVADGDQREAGSVRLAVRRQRRGSGGPLAPAEHVRAHHVIAVRVDGRAGSDQALPPARRRMPDDRGTGRMGVARQRVQDQDRVGPGPVQLTPRLVGDRHVRKAAARLERERCPSTVRDHGELAPPRLVPGSPNPWERRRGHAPLAARNPASRSARMSSIDSMPTERRTRSGVTPVVVCSASVS